MQRRILAPVVFCTSLAVAGLTAFHFAAAREKMAGAHITKAALYPEDQRRNMTSDDYRRFPGAGVLFCRDDEYVPHRAAASWLIGSRRLVMMNAHNFRDRHADVTRTIDTCFFQIGGKNYDFEPESLQLGIASDAKFLHITDDWALVRLHVAVDADIAPNRFRKPLAWRPGVRL